jgi:signal transduction histidine kinase
MSPEPRSDRNPSDPIAPATADLTATIQNITERIARGDPVADTVKAVFSGLRDILGFREIELQASSETLRQALDSLFSGSNDDRVQIRYEKWDIDERLKILEGVYFSRPEAWLGANPPETSTDEKHGDAAPADRSWLESDFLLFALPEASGQALVSVRVNGTSDGRIPHSPVVAMGRVLSLMAVMVVGREFDKLEREGRSSKILQKTDLLEDVLYISSSIVSEKDLQNLATMILSTVSSLFGFKKATLIVYDEAVGAFRWIGLFGYPDEIVRETRFRTIPLEIVLEDLAETRKIRRSVYFTPREELSAKQMTYFVIPRPLKEPSAGDARRPGEFRDGDVLAFALHDSTGRLVGVLYPSEPIDWRLSEEDTLDTLEIFTSLAEVAVENARLTSDRETALLLIAQRTEQLSRIFDLTSDILYVRDLDQMLEDILKTLAQLLGMKRMTIGIRQGDSESFKVQAVYGYSEERSQAIKQLAYSIDSLEQLVDPRKRDSPTSTVKWNRKIGRMTYYNPGEGYRLVPEDMLYYPDTELLRLPRKGEGYWHELDYMETFIHDREGVAIAFLEILKPKDDRIPDPETIEIIEIFASLAGIAIENGRMFQAMSDSKNNAEFYTDLLSHDIKNFNQAIIGYLDLLKMTMDRPDQLSAINKMSEQVMNVSRLANNVRTMSKLTWGTIKLTRVDLGSVLLDCIRSVPQYQMTRKILFNHNAEVSKFMVMADELIRELFVNILTNAVKYDPHDPVEISINVQRDDSKDRPYVVVSVSDHGQGIPGDAKAKIFERFAAGVKKKGSGLGLHIVKTLTSRYHGQVWAEDRVQGDYTQGTVFKVRLPLSQ